MHATVTDSAYVIVVTLADQAQAEVMNTFIRQRRQHNASTTCDRSVVLSFCKQYNWRTWKRRSTKLGRHGQEVTLWKWGTFGGDLDPRVDSGSLFHVLHHWGIGDFWTFVSISIQSAADLYHTWRNDWRHNVLGQIRQTSGSGLIWKSVFESRITFGWNFGVGGGLQSLNALIFCCDDSWCCFWWHVFLYTFYRAMLCIARTICCRWSDDV